MPQTRIDFTLFSSPTEPFAIVQGSIDTPFEPGAGDTVVLDWPGDIADIDGVHVRQKVKWIIPAEGKLAALYALEDVVMADRTAAHKLGVYWAKRYNFDVDTSPFEPGREQNNPPDEG